MKIQLLALSMLFSSLGTAQCVDVYGVNAEEARTVLGQYEPRLMKITKAIIARVRADTGHYSDSPAGQQLKKQYQALMDELKSQRGYAYVYFDTIYYSKSQYCTTVEIVKRSDQGRLKYISKDEEVNYPKTHDVMDKMNEYQALGNDLFISQTIQPTHAECPVYHCTMGFEHPKLKPYLQVFNLSAVHERQFILNTLKNDPNPDRRAAAAYLVGHFSDPHDIVDTLMPYVNDPNEGVRNNVIRVISLTTLKANMTDLDPSPFVNLLDSPFGTDRNKSLFLLSVLAQSAATKHYLIQHAKVPLLDILRMKQPNQHEFAYQILKEISGQDFGSRNYGAWENWFKQQESQLS